MGVLYNCHFSKTAQLPVNPLIVVPGSANFTSLKNHQFILPT